MRSTASSGSPVQMKRAAACSSSSVSAETGEFPGIVDALLGLGRQRKWCPEAAIGDRRGAVGRVGQLDLDHALDRVGAHARVTGAGRRVRQQALGVQLSGLARRRDEATLGAGEAGALGPARGDPDRDRLGGLVVDRRAARAGTTGPRTSPALTSRARGSAPPPRAAARAARPRPGHSVPVGATSFIASPAPRPRKTRRVRGSRASRTLARRPTGGSDTWACSTLVPIRMRDVRTASAPSHGSEAGEWPPSCRNGWKWSEIATLSRPSRSAASAKPSSSAGANCSADAL